MNLMEAKETLYFEFYEQQSGSSTAVWTVNEFIRKWKIYLRLSYLPVVVVWIFRQLHIKVFKVQTWEEGGTDTDVSKTRHYQT